MLNDDIMGYMLDHTRKLNSMKPRETPVKAEISTDEALQIFNEILDLFRSHDISYQCACRLTVSLAHSFLVGAAELYEKESNKP